MPITIEAHLCQSGNIKGYIRKYPSIFCSICMARNSVDLVIQEKDIDSYNKKVIEEKRKMMDNIEPIEVPSYEGTSIVSKCSDVIITPKIEKCALCGGFELGISLTYRGEGDFGHKTHLCFNCIDQIKEQL